MSKNYFIGFSAIKQHAMLKNSPIHTRRNWISSGHRPIIYLPFKDLWTYRFLLVQLVRKDFHLFYRQTLLGPLWFFLQPALSTLVFTFAFARVAEISTDRLPAPLFYLAGLTIWNYFSECFSKTCTILRDHAQTFSKIYFPRLIVPLSIVISNLIRFGIQSLLFLLVYAFYVFLGVPVKPTWAIMLLPFLILLMAFMGLGLGLIISSLTVKYRDLAFLVTFGLQLLLFVTPVIYPLSAVPETLKYIVLANPVTAIVETFRYAFFGTGDLNPHALGYSSTVITTVLFCGLILFNKVEKNFIDLI
jgi:lipopolysaccharide transport system permease protein